MKQFIYIAILLISGVLITACGSSKSTSRQEISIESKSQTNRKDTTVLREQVNKVEAENVTEETEEVTTVYDTSKPNDPTTGRSPILSETIKSTKKDSNQKKKESADTMFNQFHTEQVNDRTEISDRTEKDKQEVETTVPKQISGVIWALATFIGLIIIGFIIWSTHKK